MPVPNKLPYRYMKSGESVTLTADTPEEIFNTRLRFANTKHTYKKNYGIEMEIKDGAKPNELIVTVVYNPKPLAKPRAVPTTKAKPKSGVSRIERSARSVYRDVLVGAVSFGAPIHAAVQYAGAAMDSYRNTLEQWRAEDEARAAQ